MKKIFIMLLITIAAMFIINFLGDLYRAKYVDNSVETEDIIRLHVIADSDSSEDQRIKLMVRDEIIRHIGDELEICSDATSMADKIKNKLNYIEQIADSVLMQNGFDDKVKAEFGKFNFPVRAYGDMVLPAGEYTALKIKIGSAKGANWWCVVYPPLCFADITTGELPEIEKDEAETLDDDSEEPVIENRFKIAELWEKWFEKS